MHLLLGSPIDSHPLKTFRLGFFRVCSDTDRPDGGPPMRPRSLSGSKHRDLLSSLPTSARSVKTKGIIFYLWTLFYSDHHQHRVLSRRLLLRPARSRFCTPFWSFLAARSCWSVCLRHQSSVLRSVPEERRSPVPENCQSESSEEWRSTELSQHPWRRMMKSVVLMERLTAPLRA